MNILGDWLILGKFPLYMCGRGTRRPGWEGVLCPPGPHFSHGAGDENRGLLALWETEALGGHMFFRKAPPPPRLLQEGSIRIPLSLCQIPDDVCGSSVQCSANSPLPLPAWWQRGLRLEGWMTWPLLAHLAPWLAPHCPHPGSGLGGRLASHEQSEG